MNHIADSVSSRVINAHMMDTEFVLDTFAHAKVALYDKDKNLKYGTPLQKIDFTKDFYIEGENSVLVSGATASHLGVRYVVVQSAEYAKSIARLQQNILLVTLLVALVIIIIAVMLSYIFLQPIKNKMQEIEDFVKDTTHELNTPLTALMMSTSRAKSKKLYDEKIMQNISISTKQLYDIYASLSYISFDAQGEESHELFFDKVVKNSIEYFNELLERKNIRVESHISPCTLHMAPSKAKMLINNLLGNAIKYSHPNTKIRIQLSDDYLMVQDEGIGIEKEKLQSIFERFTRANDYAGGFGVGLNIVESIAKEYGFEIDISSKIHKGTTLTVRFQPS